MPHGLPNRRHGRLPHAEEEQVLEDDGQVLQIVPINIDCGDAADHPGGGHDAHPVPRPPPPDEPEALRLADELLAVLGQVHQREHDGYPEEGAESDAEVPARLDRQDRHRARGAVGEGAIGEKHGLVGGEDEEAVGGVAEGVVGVEGVVPVLQRGGVEVDAVYDGVCGVVPVGGEGEEVADVYEGHLVGFARG